MQNPYPDDAPTIPIEIPANCTVIAHNTAIGPVAAPNNGEPGLSPDAWLSQEMWTTVTPALVHEAGLEVVRVEAIPTDDGLVFVPIVVLNVYISGRETSPRDGTDYDWEQPGIFAVVRDPDIKGLRQHASAIIYGPDLTCVCAHFAACRETSR